MKKIFILDTSVFLTDYNSLFSFGESDIIVPLKVLEEIDKHKTRQDGVGANARNTIRVLDSLREDGNLHKGVHLGENKGTLSVRGYDPFDLPDDFDMSCADNQIIGTAITEKKRLLDAIVVVVTRDINMRVKCDSLEIPTEDFVPHEAIRNLDGLYTGFIEHLVDDQIIDRFYDGEPIYLKEPEIQLFSNQYIMLISNINEKKTALASFCRYEHSLGRVKTFKNGVWGVLPRNKEQMFSLDLLMNPEIPIVTLFGRAGSGKTLLALAAGLEQVLEKTIYKKLVVSRPVQPMGRDIGFLPGTIEEKMIPWLMPIQDNLEYLMGDDKTTLDMYIDNGTIQMEALSYIRGRSIPNAYMIIDEAQNLTTHELKTIVTRVGEGTKIILTGDVEQIDSIYLDETTNGLSHAVNRFKNTPLAGHMQLVKGERSKVATLAAEIL
tara:strand:- start:25275 stop:26582 length:1308 start_codon:yes stop_codon:yes gene_type:complete